MGHRTQYRRDRSLDYRRLRIAVRSLFEPRATGDVQHPVRGCKWDRDDSDVRFHRSTNVRDD